MTNLLIIAGIGVVLFFITVWSLLSRYKKCPANKMLVVFGKTGKDKVAKCLNGGGTFIWPIVQGYSFMDLTPMQFMISLENTPSKSYIPVSIDSNVTMQISPDQELMQIAAINLLGLGQPEIIKMVKEIVLGCLRQVIANMEVEELNEDRDTFKEKSENIIKSELEKIGIKLVNLTIAEITDSVGYIDALGKQSAEKALTEARIKVTEQKKIGDTQVAIQEKEKQISVSQTEKERVVKTAEIQKEREVTIASTKKEQTIQTAEISRDQEVRSAEIEKETQVGLAKTDAEREVGIAVANADKEVGVTKAESQKAILKALAQKEQRVEVAKTTSEATKGEFDAQQQVAVAASELEVVKTQSTQTAESAKVIAVAKVKEDNFNAQVKQEEARGRAVETQLNAEIIVPAEMQKRKLIIEAEAEAEAKKTVAKGEADSLLMIKKAEADGKQKSLEADAEGFRKMVEAAGTNPEMAIQYLMVGKVDILAQRQSEAMQAIHLENVTLFDSSKGEGVGNFVNGIMSQIAPTLNMAKTLNLGTGIGEIKKQITEASKDNFEDVK